MNRVTIGLVLCALPLVTIAQQLHSDHPLHTMSHGTQGAEAVPDGALAPTGMEISTAQRCALAARGVVMLDNAEWQACGGKPATVPQSVVPSSSATSHTGH